QRSERVPAARPAVALLHGEVNRTRMGVLQQPGAVWLLLAPHDLDGVREPRVSRATGGPEVVERGQHIVVPLGREREFEPCLVAHLARGGTTVEPAQLQVLLGTTAGLNDGHRSPGTLVLEQTVEHAERRVE